MFRIGFIKPAVSATHSVVECQADDRLGLVLPKSVTHKIVDCQEGIRCLCLGFLARRNQEPKDDDWGCNSKQHAAAFKTFEPCSVGGFDFVSPFTSGRKTSQSETLDLAYLGGLFHLGVGVRRYGIKEQLTAIMFTAYSSYFVIAALLLVGGG